MHWRKHSVIGGPTGVNQHLERIQSCSLQAGKTVVQVATYLWRTSGEVKPDLVALDADGHFNRDIGGAHAIVIEHVGKPVSPVWQVLYADAHAAFD